MLGLAFGAPEASSQLLCIDPDRHFKDALVVRAFGPRALGVFPQQGAVPTFFAELGKLEELVFGWWPGTAAPFLRAYHRHFPPAPGDGVRRRLGVGLYELGQLAYFARWQPDLVPVYRERLGRWLAAPAPSPQEV